MVALRFINVFTGGLAAGGLLIVLVSYAAALRQMTALEASRLHSLFHPPTHRWMQLSTIVAAATAVAIATWDTDGWSASTVLVLAGLLGAAAQAILSRFWVVPASDELIAWHTTGTEPEDYPRFIRRWSILHSGRVAGAIEAFVCYLLAVLLR